LEEENMGQPLFVPNECVAFAARCMELAKREVDPVDREIWARIAKGWLDLAVQIEGPAAPTMGSRV
jgi:hypothetical protein